MEKLVLNKNRGWRGLAEAHYLSDDNTTIQKMIFSFSQPVWNDMLRGCFVMQDNDNYIVLKFDPEKSKLPAPTQQRSILLKNVTLAITEKAVYPKASWTRDHRTVGDFAAIHNFIKNRNNHTTSDWNCIGVRVIPMI